MTNLVAGAKSVDLLGRRVSAVNSSVPGSNVIAPGASGALCGEFDGTGVDGDTAGEGVVGIEHQGAGAVHDQRSGAGVAARIGRAGHVGDHAGNGLRAGRREGERLVALKEDVAAVGLAVRRAAAATGAEVDAAVAQRSVFDGQRAALLHEDVAAGAKAAAAAIAAGGAAAEAASRRRAPPAPAETAAAATAKAAIAAGNAPPPPPPPKPPSPPVPP